MSTKKLLELGIIVIAIIMLYKGLETFIQSLISTMYSMGYYGSNFTTSFLIAGVYIICFLVFVKGRKQIVSFILPEKEDNNLSVNIRSKELIYIIIIALCIITLITCFVTVISFVIDYFQVQVGPGPKEMDLRERIEFKIAAIKGILALLLVYFADPVAEFFSSRLTARNVIEFKVDEEP